MAGDMLSCVEKQKLKSTCRLVPCRGVDFVVFRRATALFPHVQVIATLQQRLWFTFHS